MQLLSRFLNNFTVAQKFAILGTPILISLCMLFYSYSTTILGLVNATKQEQVGIENVVQLDEIILVMQKHRGLNALARADNQNVIPEINQIKEQVDEKITNALNIVPENYTATRNALTQIQSQWNNLKLEPYSTDSRSNFRKHSKLIFKVITAIRLNADESTMTYDPEAGTYYLVSAINFTMPLLLEEMAIIRGKLSKLAQSNTVNQQEIGKVEALLETMAHRVDEVDQSLLKVTQNDIVVPANILALSKSLGTILQEIKAVESQVKNNAYPNSGETLFNQITGYIEQVKKLNYSMIELLKKEFQNRIDKKMSAFWFNISIISLVILLAVLLAISIFKTMAQQIKTLTRQTSNLSEGNLLPTALVNSKDEFGLISKAIEEIRQSQTQIISNLNKTTKKLLESTNTINQSSKEIHTSAADQSESTSSVAASIEELTTSVEQVTSFSNDSYELAHKMGQSAEVGFNCVRETRNAIDNIANTSKVLATKIESLGERSLNISSVIQVIEAIAEQTNLLALNAAIEAARAGEHGRGFAVVADEVRKLSEKTSQSTQNISELITGIQSDTKQAVDQVSGWKHTIEKGIGDAQTAETGMQEISAYSKETEKSVEEIKDSLIEQNKASSLIAQRIEDIAQMTEKSQLSAEKAHSEVDKLKQVSQELDELVSRFKINAA